VIIPLNATTRPSGIVVADGYQRAIDMSGALVHARVAGSNKNACLIPTSPAAWPPTISTRPSASIE